jgi:hypothetical protein
MVTKSWAQFGKYLAVVAVMTLVACGQDGGQDKETANVPQSNNGKNTCYQNGGYGCSWNALPRGWSQYPRNPQYPNYYQNYTPNYGWQQNNSFQCPPVYQWGRWVQQTAVRGWNGALACAPIQQNQNLYRDNSMGGQVAQACDMSLNDPQTGANQWCPNYGPCGGLPNYAPNTRAARVWQQDGNAQQQGLCQTQNR